MRAFLFELNGYVGGLSDLQIADPKKHDASFRHLSLVALEINCLFAHRLYNNIILGAPLVIQALKSYQKLAK